MCHDNKIHAPIAAWPQEQFSNSAPILTHSCILKQTSQRFSSKKLVKFQILTNRSYVRWLYVSSEGHITTYRYFFVIERKKPLNYQAEQHVRAIVKFLYLSRIPQLTRKFQFLSRICQMVTCRISGTCHHEGNLARVH